MSDKKRGRIAISELLNKEEEQTVKLEMGETVKLEMDEAVKLEMDEAVKLEVSETVKLEVSETVKLEMGEGPSQAERTEDTQEESSGDASHEGGHRSGGRTSGDGESQELQELQELHELQELQMARRKRWTSREDRLLVELVEEFGPSRWKLIAEKFPDRDGQHLRLRWMNHLRPSLDKSAWTSGEDETILRLQRTHGNSWVKIASALPGRSDNAVKNRFYLLKRYQTQEGWSIPEKR